MRPICYRRDIDGLRGVAVTIVVAYHVGVPGFGGGFVGVDVFFVISGFLITKLLLDELRERGSIDLLAFYARRARRLLPAFFLVIGVTLLLGALFLLPVDGEQRGLANSAKAAALYFSNLYFARTTGGYFDNSSEFLPLLHTWSLAVEEQFYFVWPLLLIGCAWAARHWRRHLTGAIAAVLLVVFVMSLTYSYLMSEAGGRAARFAFFALPSRAWELAVGAALALALPYLKASETWLGVALAGAGLLAIAASVASFQDSMPLPGIAALVPTLGAAAIIGGWCTPVSAVHRVLSTRFLVGIGLLSYSWYLWHWPLLAIVRARDMGTQDVWRDALTALAALGLAWLTYVWVEHPIRNRKIWSVWGNVRVLSASAAASLVLIAGAYGLAAYADQLSRSDRYQRLARASDDKTWRRAHCHHNNGRCEQAAGTAYRGLVILWGDSHADHIAGTLHTSIAPHGLALLSRDMGGCPPVTGTVVFAGMRAIDEKCSRFNAAVLAEIDRMSRQGELAAVVLSARWSLYLGQPLPSGRTSPRIVAMPGQPPSIDTAASALYFGLKATVATLMQRGIKVLMVASVPEHRHNIPKCLARASLELCSIGRGAAEEHRHAALVEMKAVLRDAPGARLWDPFMALCGLKQCLAERDGVILYHDDGHLTYGGSLWLAPYLAETAAWLAGTSRASSTEHYFLHTSEDVKCNSEAEQSCLR